MSGTFVWQYKMQHVVHCHKCMGTHKCIFGVFLCYHRYWGWTPHAIYLMISKWPQPWRLGDSRGSWCNILHISMWNCLLNIGIKLPSPDIPVIDLIWWIICVKSIIMSEWLHTTKTGIWLFIHAMISIKTSTGLRKNLWYIELYT